MASRRALAFQFICALILCNVCAAWTWAALDLQPMEAAGLVNKKRLASSRAQWITDITLPGGAVATIATLRTPTASRYIVSVSFNGQSEELVRVIERDGIWYVRDHHSRATYRPYEYRGENSLLYISLVRSVPIFLTADSRAAIGNVVSTDSKTATFSAPVPDPIARQVKNMIAQVEQLKRAQPGNALSPEAADMLAKMKSFQVQGITTVVDLSNGLIIENRSFKLPTVTHDFHFIDHDDSAEFATPGNWEDNTSDPTVGDVNELLMIGHYPDFTPGMKTPDVDGQLFNVKTLQFRRLPFHGALSMPGCFLPGRTRVVVTGVDLNGGANRPYLLDLRTGENRALGGALTEVGTTMFESLSPDGKHVVCQRVGTNEDVLKSDVLVIDLPNGHAHQVGEPMDVGPVYWTPDRRLLLLRRESRNVNGPAQCFVSIMDLNGKVTDLRRGDQVTPLADNQRILFQDEATQLWHTCDYRGQNDSLFGDGLAHYGFPAPAPDGKRILMMHFIEGQAPIPTLLAVGQSSGTPLTQAPGLWASPRWR